MLCPSHGKGRLLTPRSNGPGNRFWLVYATLGLLAIAASFAVGDAIVATVVNATLGLSVSAILAVAPRRRGLCPAWPWHAGAAGLLALAIAATLGHVHELTTGHTAPFPSWIDGLSLAGYPLLAVAIFGFSTVLHADRRREGLLDAAVATCAIAALVWEPLLHAYTSESSLSTAGAAVLLARAASVLLVIALAARLVVTARVHSPTARLLATGTAAYLATDVAHHQTLTSFGPASPVHLGSLLAYVLLGSAALHPSAAELGETLPAEFEPGSASGITLASASVLIPGIFLYEELADHGIALGALLFGFAGVGFVVARLALGLRTVERLRATEREAAVALEDARASLMASEARFRLLAETSQDVIAIVEPDGRFRYASPTIERFSGHPSERVRGIHALDLVHPDDRDIVSRTLASVLATPRTVGRVEYRTRPRDGSVYVLEAIVQNLMDEPGIGALAAVVRDVTERKAAEAEREEALALIHTQNAMLREVDRQRSELISVVSHDLRTPLTAIMGYLELMADGDAGPLTAEQSSFVDIIKRSAERLLTLVEDLLLVSSAEAGRLRLARVVTDVAGIAAQAVQALRPRADSAGVRLTLDARAAPACVDATRIAEVIENLLSNALKFTPHGGSVEVRAFPAAGVAVLEVADTGVGISDADRTHVFDRFFRSQETDHVPGVGLGLAIVKAIVDAHDGRVAVDSETGEGTVFRIELPVAPPQPVSAPPTELATGAP